MKSIIFLLNGLLLLLLFSCENREDITTVDIETELIAEISVTTSNDGALNLKSTQLTGDFSFSGTCVFCLSQNPDLNKPMCIINSIKPCEGCKIVFRNIEVGGNVVSCKLNWDSKSNEETDFDMQNEFEISPSRISIQNGNLEIDLSGIIVPFVNCMETNPKCLYRIDITGTTDFMMPSTGELIIPVIVESKVYSANFTVF